MKKRNNLIYVLALVLTLISCEKEVKYKEELLAPKLVVSGLLEVDSTCVIYLERTYNFMENEPELKITSGATITIENLTDGTSFSVATPTDSNRYEFPFVVTSNTDYRLTVTHPDFPTVTASTRTTGVVPLISVDTATAPYYGYDHFQTTWKWLDPPGENYYMISGWITGEDSLYSFDLSGPTGIASQDPIADNQSDDPLNDYNGDRYFVFPDESFDSQMKTFVGYSNNWYVHQSYYTHVVVKYTLSNINRDAYLYYKSLQKQMNIDPTLSEPVKVYTNIENGFGIFACTNHQQVIFE